MSGHRWSKFWWQDWQREPSLRMCSLAARGLWMELLCIAHDGEPYGHVTVNGRVPTTRQISGVAGTSESETNKLIRELEAAGVFSRDDNGAIYCRRMVKDKERSELGHKTGKTGGNPALKGKVEHKVNGGGNPGGLTPDLNRGPIPQEAEAEFKKKDSEAIASGTAGAAPLSARDQLWAEGLVLLRGLTGQSDRQARALLGKLLSAAKDDCSNVFNALWEASEARPIDPTAWLMAAVKPRKPSGNPFLDPSFDEENPGLPPFLEITHVH